MTIRKLIANQRGAAVVEMALALPILLLFIYGIFEIGIVMAADAGMQHALGEGARMMTLYPTPTDSAVKTKITSKVFGVYVGSYTAPTVTTPLTTDCAHCKDLAISYSVTPNFLFFNGPQVTFNRTKRVYLSF